MYDITVFYSLYKLFLLILGGILIRLILFPLLPPTLQETLKHASEVYLTKIHEFLKYLSQTNDETLDEKLLYGFLAPLSITIVAFSYLADFIFKLQGFYTLKYFLLILITSIFIFLIPSLDALQERINETSPTELFILGLKTITSITLLFMVPVIPAWISLSFLFIPIPSFPFSSFGSSVELLQ